MDDLLRLQWTALMRWLAQIELDAHVDLPTGLGEWSVGDLVAHLGLGLGLTTGVQSLHTVDRALSLGEYVAAYQNASADIADMTRRTRVELGTRPLEGLGTTGERVWAALSGLDEEYVLARRGPIRREDYVITRLIELVVHGDDLWRSLGTGHSPVLPEALGVVSAALITAYRERTGEEPPAADDLVWVRLACGRMPSSDPALPLLR